MNTKAASEKGYHFKHGTLVLVISALPFIITFSLFFHCHCFVRANTSPGFAGGSEGDRKGDEKGVGWGGGY